MSDATTRLAVKASTPRVLRARHATSAAASNGQVAWLVVRGARHNNLKNIDARFPLGRFTCVTGVSGSGKSSLVNDILYQALARELNGATTAHPGAHAGIEGLEHLDKVIAIDQSPIGRTPRSNPATYIKVFDEIRGLFARLPDARLRGYKPGRFSFNVPVRRGGGRCEACEGNGANRIGMDFLADVWVPCPLCEGRRFGRETLQIHYKGKSIADVLNMEVHEALRHFENVPRVRGMLQTLHDVGLDYIQLGQPSTTLSGGEAQRIKLARELVKKPTGRTLYVLDEPTTGLHFDDIRKLLAVLHGFVDAGNTVIVIEHNLDVVKTADWIIDLGPEGGEAGGYIVAEGTPEQIAACPQSYTGQALAPVLRGEKAAPIASAAPAGAHWASRPTAEPGGSAPGDQADEIRVVGARQHNLRDVTVSFPRERITVCTGLSGSGKSSFAIDTVFTEGYRRYVESLSAYARQFLGQLAKPRVERVEGLSPAICIEQKAAGRSPRSTVGTITEIYDYMRVLWARLGTRYCPRCQVPIGTQTVDEIVARVLGLPAGTPIVILAPVGLGDGESYASLFRRLKSSGYLRVRIDGEIRPTAEATTLDARRRHRVEVVVDRTTVRDKSRGRIAESVEHALALGNGVMTLLVEPVETVSEVPTDGSSASAGDTAALGATVRTPARELMFSQKLVCLRCGESFEELGPNHFSFNHQLGWCETCEGLGVQRGAAPSEIIVRPQRSLFDGAIAGWARIERNSPFGRILKGVCRHLGVSPDAPLSDWTPAQRKALLFGADDIWIDAGDAYPGVRVQWRGFFPTIDHAARTWPEFRYRVQHVVTDIPCMTCRGGRLRPDAAAVRLGGKTIVEVCEVPLRDAAAFFETLRLDSRQRRIAGEVLKEIRSRLQFLIDVGLHYLTLHRAAPTLSGGEAQRIRLASQIGSGLSGVLYVLDEPTIGLHPRDTRLLIDALVRLRDLGNTLLLVEHDRDVIRHADRLLDFGPGAGRAGGQIVALGTPDELHEVAPDGGATSLTRAYLTGELAIPIPKNRRAVPPWRPGRAKGWLVVRGARHNNLKNLTVPIPLGRLVCVTGVSGSGKSSLVNDILWPALARALHHARLTPGDHEGIDGLEQLDKVVNVDQSPIGQTPSSNPATYTGVFDDIRELFARLPESKLRGYTANRFSFNRPGGRCEACEGCGQRRIEMHFMPDVWIECETCRGRRYNPETLEVKFKGRSIADVLELTVAEALGLFANVPRVRRMLETLADVGLDYLPLGQPAPTLSGGEAQRVKLAAELGKPNTGRTFYILDEPTTGLHFDDIRKLLAVMHRLVDLGNTVLVVEHNLDVIKCADWIIDLGPEAGEEGGYIVAAGTPEDIVRCDARYPAVCTERAARGRGSRARRGTAGRDDQTQEPAAAGLPASSEDGGAASLARHANSLFRSHTAAALKPVLEAGPYEERRPYDAHEHAARVLAAEKEGFGDVGKEVRMPWQVDGRRWHLEQRNSRNERPRRWDPAALEFVVELVEAAGREARPPGSPSAFAPTDWNNRASVEITAPNARYWFLHALTGGEWLLELYFRIPPGVFAWRTLDESLGLKTLDERDDLEVYGDWSRVDVRRRNDGWDAVVLYVHDRQEIDTPAFRRFVRRAVQAYLDGLRNGR